MKAKMLRAILENIHDDIDINVQVNGYDTDVGSFFFNDEQGYFSLIPIEDEDDGYVPGEPWDDDEEPSTGTSCDLPEPVVRDSSKIKVL